MSQKSGVLDQFSKHHYSYIPEDFDVINQNSIETGYFVFTMMPSLRCSLSCPHCYLSLDQRRNSPIMTVEQISIACQKVKEYYDQTDIRRKMMVFYWYGGEPTEMGLDYMVRAFENISAVFKESDGYYVRHEILTSLINVEKEWFDIFNTYGRGHFQTSFDGLMRGKGYVRKWEKKIKEAVGYGLSVSTISVVNNELIKDSPKDILDYLSSLGISDASFLPFMLNEQNSGDKYEKYAPPMSVYSDFMIEMNKEWVVKKQNGLHVPYIGQTNYIVTRDNLSVSSNIAGQTMFLLPEGDFVLPDYRNGYLEYMNPFGNIFKSSFFEILNSPERKSYLRKQYLRNRNPECVSCEYKNSCIMEFWKENRVGDECFGAKRLVDYVKNNPFIVNEINGLDNLIF